MQDGTLFLCSNLVPFDYDSNIHILMSYTYKVSAKWPLDSQYYFATFLPRINYAIFSSLEDSILPRRILFCLWFRLSEYAEWHWCSLCDHHFVSVLQNEKESLLDHSLAHTKSTIYARKSCERESYMSQWSLFFCCCLLSIIWWDTQDC